jgi:hypothetical protein
LAKRCQRACGARVVLLGEVLRPFGRDIVRRHRVAGADQIGRHRHPHVAHADEADACDVAHVGFLLRSRMIMAGRLPRWKAADV